MDVRTNGFGLRLCAPGSHYRLAIDSNVPSNQFRQSGELAGVLVGNRPRSVGGNLCLAVALADREPGEFVVGRDANRDALVEVDPIGWLCIHSIVSPESSSTR